jgi:hypothetical protein
MKELLQINNLRIGMNFASDELTARSAGATTDGLPRVMMKLATQLLLSLGASCLASFAVAAPVVHDTIAEFSSITANQGQRSNNAGNGFDVVAASRSNIANVFDNNLATIYSLGLGGTGAGGTLDFVISPVTNLISSGTVIELTTGGVTGSGHIEFAQVFLGVNGGGWQLVGELGNDGSVDGTGAIAGALLSANLMGNTTTFSLTVSSGAYNSVRFADVSPLAGANRDGFDIAEFRVTSTPVSEPATLALVGLSLVGLSVMRRRQA